MKEVANFLGVTVRAVERGEYASKPAKIVIASAEYETDIEDLWDAITDAQRISRWLCPVTGDLRLSGRYHLEGNASGLIKECERPSHLGLTWEYDDQATWVSVDLDQLQGDRTSLRLQHFVPDDDKWRTFGPGAVGVGWDLALLELARHLSNPYAAKIAHGIDRVTSNEANNFVAACCNAWCAADIAFGTDRVTAEERSTSTRQFYTRRGN